MSQMVVFMKPSARRNVRLLLRFLVVLLVLVVIYSVLFHVLMVHEGQSHSWLTGLYWTLTVMSTLGFGDITFATDLGRVFSIVVLISGMVFLLMLLPFTFIEFFYAPWMQAQSEARAPRQLPFSTSGHVILTHYDAVSLALIGKLVDYGYPYVLLVGDLATALRLHDEGLNVMLGEPDLPQTYSLARVERALMVAATGSDTANTNVAFTVRELSQKALIATTAELRASKDILELAGSSQVVQLPEMMGHALARRITGADARAHVIGNFGKLLIAEATAAGTPLEGKRIADTRIREHTGVTIVGVWQRGVFTIASANTIIDTHSVVVLAGSVEQLRAYDELFCIYNVNNEPVIIIGAGKVGQVIARALAAREVEYRLVESDPARIVQGDEHYVHGSAADLAILTRAGIQNAPAVVVTPDDDDTSIYLTIYCRRLRPDIQILSRATRERNVATLHRAGADFVLSYASMGATAMFNVLKQTSILMLAEGLHVAETMVPAVLAGKTLAAAQIPQQTQCTVVALRKGEQININPGPSTVLETSAELILICTPEAEQRFVDTFQAVAVRQKPISADAKDLVE